MLANFWKFFLDALEKISKNFATSQFLRRGKRETGQAQVIFNLFFKKRVSPDWDGNYFRPGTHEKGSRREVERFSAYLAKKFKNWAEIPSKNFFRGQTVLKTVRRTVI